MQSFKDRSPRAGIATEVDAHDAAVMLAEGFEIPQRLGADEGAERVGTLRNGLIVRLVRRDLDEQAGIGPALVELARGVEKARPVADRRRDMEPLKEVPPDLTEQFIVFGVSSR